MSAVQCIEKHVIEIVSCHVLTHRNLSKKKDYFAVFLIGTPKEKCAKNVKKALHVHWSSMILRQRASPDLIFVSRSFLLGADEKCDALNTCNNGKCEEEEEEKTCSCNTGFTKDANDLCNRKGRAYIYFTQKNFLECDR